MGLPWEQRKAALVGLLCGAAFFVFWRVYYFGLPEESDQVGDILSFVLSVVPCVAAACAVTAVRNLITMNGDNRDHIDRRRGAAKPRR